MRLKKHLFSQFKKQLFVYIKELFLHRKNEIL